MFLKGGGMKKIKLSKRKAYIFDTIFTVLFIGFAFWADWKIGLAFIFYDISRVCEKVREELESFERISRFVRKNYAQEENYGAAKTPSGENQQS
jgi:hypothetical protein